MTLREKLEVLNDAIYYIYNVMEKMKLNDDLPELYMFLLGERSAIYKKINELKEEENGNTNFDNR